MKFVLVPKSIQPINPVTRKPFVEAEDETSTPVDMQPLSLHGFLMRYVVNEQRVQKDATTGQVIGEPKIGKGYEGSKRIAKLDAAFEKANEGDAVGVEDADWSAVKKILEEKVWVLPIFGACFIPFQEAWMQAERQDDEWFRKRSNGAGTTVAASQ